jgi:hypothetical protein
MHPDLLDGTKFHPLYQEGNSNKTLAIIQEVSFDSPLRLIDYHPSDALDYPVLVSWNFTKHAVDFAINGSYHNESAREIVEPLKQIAFYLPIGGIIGLPLEYFKRKSEKEEAA